MFTIRLRKKQSSGSCLYYVDVIQKKEDCECEEVIQFFTVHKNIFQNLQRRGVPITPESEQ